MKLFELFDDYCAMSERKLRLQFAWQNPALISSRLLPTLETRLKAENGPATAQRKELLLELDALRQYLAQDASRYPAGVGPIERLAARVGQGEISFETAVQTVRTANFAEQLAPLYVHVLIWHAEHLAVGGKGGQAMVWTRLLAEACLAAFPEDPPSPLVTDAAVGWIQICGMTLAAVPDGEVLAAADELGGSLADRLAGPKDAARKADLLHALGVLYSDPFTSTVGIGIQADSRRIWQRRLEAEKGAALARRYLEKFPLPEAEAALQKAVDYFERALPDRVGAGKGITSKALAQTLIFLARSRKAPVDKPRVESLLTDAMRLLEPDNYHYAAAVRLLRSLGAESPGDKAREPTPSTPDEVLQRVSALEHGDPAQALSLLAETGDLFNQLAAEPQRVSRFVAMLRLMADTNGGAASDRFDGPLKDNAEKLFAAAGKEEWPMDQLGAVMLRLIMRAGRTNEEVLGLEWLQFVTQKCPTLAQRQAPIAFLFSELCIGAAVNAVDANDPVTAVRHYGQAVAPSLRLQLPSRTLEILDSIADLAVHPHEDMGLTVICALAPVAFEIERGLGSPGAEALQSAYQRVFSAFGDSVNSSIVGMILQLAKGLRFSISLRQAPGINWRDDSRAIDLCRNIAATQKQSGELAARSAIDEVLLISSVSSVRPLGGAAATERLHNLQREFDRHVNHLVSQGSSTSSILKPEMIQQLLGPRTVLLDYYFAADGENQPALHTLIYTAEEIVGARNPIHGSADRSVMETSNVEAVVDFIGMRTYEIRQALQQEPGAELMTREAKSALQKDFGLFLGKSTWAYLEQLRATGKDHLCIRPHGAMRYYPMHLLGPGDECLAQHWIVTSIPSLECLLPRETAPREIPGEVLGLTYAGGKPFPLEELTNARNEVETVAQILGTSPILDAAVTEDRVFQAFATARRMHLCAHGAHDAAAPLFQRLFVTPSANSDGRICAYEILGHDLRGLEVVTLGTCDSALGRFDAGDNLSGLPAALFAAGTATIVASLWEMLDPAALEFFKVFYQELRQDRPRLDAFRKAQLAVRAAFPQARDWAAFCYLGAWDTGIKIPHSDEDLYITLE